MKNNEFIKIAFHLVEVELLGVLSMSIGLSIFLIIQILSINLGIGYIGGFIQNRIYLMFSFASIVVYLILYMQMDIVASILWWGILYGFIYFIQRDFYTPLFCISLSFFIYIYSSSAANCLYDIFNWKPSILVDGLLGAGYFWSILYFIKKRFLKKITCEVERIEISTFVFTFTNIIYFALICADHFPFLLEYGDTANEIVMFLYGLMTTLIFITLLFIKKRDFEARMQQKEMKHLVEYSEQIEKNYTELLKFKHDYKNILISLEDYIQTNDMEGLQAYFYKSIKATETIFDKNNLQITSIANLKIKELKSIILSKLYAANQKGIEISVMIPETIERIDLSTITLVRMLGILLDNAIEESFLVNNPKIELVIMKQENFHSVVLVNQCQANIPKLHELKKTNFTTKKGNHGIGLTNLDELVRANNNVFLETNIKDNQFIQIIRIHEKRR